MTTPNGEPTKTIELIEQVRRSSRWERWLLIGLLTWAVLVNTAAVGFMTWNTWRVKQIGTANHDFAKAHASASYSRAVTTIHVLQCQSNFFLQYLQGDKPPMTELDRCFTAKLAPAAVKVPLQKEHDGRLKGTS